MARDLNVTNVGRGLNALVDDSTELQTGSADDGTENVLYENGTLRSAFGFAKVVSAGLPLDSGNDVLAFFNYGDLDATQHLLSVTTNKIYRKDIDGTTWQDLTQSGVNLGASIFRAISHASSLHTDGLPINGTGANAYKHSIICPGTQTPVQRWAGRLEDDYADLVGADGYHHPSSWRTRHYAQQVGTIRTHMLMISAKEADAAGNLVENNERIRWGAVGKLETWSGTGTGFVDLFETGGHNVWGAPLGNSQWIEYQNNAIWSLSWIGGSDVFRPNIEIPGLGLLSPHLLTSKNNVHYFVGTDFNVYSYQGGTVLQKLGNGIQPFLERDLSETFATRSWIVAGPGSKRIWIFYVQKAELSEFCLHAYIVDTRSGSWMKRTFDHKWPIANNSGITAAASLGTGSFTVGPTYADIIGESSPSKAVAIGGCVRSSNVVTTTTAVPHGFIVGETVVLASVDSGGEANAFSGSFTIVSKPTSTTITHSQTGADESNLAAGTATVDKPPTYQDYENSEETYRELLTEVLTEERIHIGDHDGYVYAFDDLLNNDDGVDIPCWHLTEVLDGGMPNDNKVWPQLHVNAKGTTVSVYYRVDNFQTTDTGWVLLGTSSLTSEYLDYEYFPNITSKKIQFMIGHATDDFEVSKYVVSAPSLQGEV